MLAQQRTRKMSDENTTEAERYAADAQQRRQGAQSSVFPRAADAPSRTPRPQR